MTRPPAWELAAETVAEARRFGGVPSLERLGDLGQLGGLSALIDALDDDETLAGAAIVHAREREGLGLAAGEIVAELLALGRVLARHGLHEEREAVDWCLMLLFERVTAELGEQARRDPLNERPEPRGLPRADLDRGRPRPALPRAAGARPLRPRPLQGDQRHRGPRRGRPDPARLRGRALGLDPRQRHGRPPGRRRVRRPPPPGRAVGDRGVPRAHPARGFPRASPRAPASRTSPRCRARPPTCSPSPTGGSTTTRAPARPRPRAASSASARSGGSGDTTSTSSLVNGWTNASRAACRNWRSRPRSPAMP